MIALGALGWAASILISLSLGAITYLALATPDAWLSRRVRAYGDLLDDDARFLRLPLRGSRIASAHLLAIAACVSVAVIVGAMWVVFMVPVLALAPTYLLRRRRELRVAAIEAQVDTWLVVLANALRASPSLGDSLASSALLLRGPLAEELDWTLHEGRLGTSLEETLSNLADRIGSPIVRGAIANLLVARRTGGDLSRTLEESAAALREMQRLEGVVRTRTAEGKSQAYVMAAMPFAMVGMIHWIDDEWLVPLVEHPMGWGLIAVAIGLWLTALGLAKRIIAVDI